MLSQGEWSFLLVRESWRPDYVADIASRLSVASRSKMVGTMCTLILHMQQPTRQGWNPVKMDLLACNRVSATMSAMIRPSNLQPRTTYLAGSKTLAASNSCGKTGRTAPARGKCPPPSYSGRSDGIVSSVHLSMWSVNQHIQC